MNNKSLMRVWVAWLLCCGFASCSGDYEDASAGGLVTDTYEGTVLDFLADEHSDSGLRFDSLNYLIENIPGLKESLGNASGHYTLFAVSDECFSSALRSLNQYRKSAKLGRELSLKDFMIEPFSVFDTLVEYRGSIGEALYDTTIVERKYDYRAVMDSLVCNYLFAESYTSTSILNEGGEIEVPNLSAGYNMTLQAKRGAASGATALGAKMLKLIDAKGSKASTEWVEANVSRMDIQANNGWIHLLDTEHEFGFNEMIKCFQNYGNEKKED